MGKMRAAIIGCGSIYHNHAGVLANCDYAELYAVCDCLPARADAAAKQYGCKAVYDYKELLSDPQVDVIHLCTPHDLHAPMAIEGMKAGKHVLTEKPMAVSLLYAREMKKAAQETGKQLGICFQNRYNAASVRAREVLHSGELGAVLGGRGIVTWNRDASYYQQEAGEWRGSFEHEGGGVLINQSIHTLDLLILLMGSAPQSLSASVSCKRLRGVVEVEDTADILLKMENGTSGVFYATNCYCGNAPVEVTICCEKGSVTVGEQLIIRRNGQPDEVLDPNERAEGEKNYWGLGHKKLITDFYSSIIEGRPFAVGPDEGLVTSCVLEAVYRSAAAGTEVRIEK